MIQKITLEHSNPNWPRKQNQTGSTLHQKNRRTKDLLFIILRIFEFRVDTVSFKDLSQAVPTFTQTTWKKYDTSPHRRPSKKVVKIHKQKIYALRPFPTPRRETPFKKYSPAQEIIIMIILLISPQKPPIKLPPGQEPTTSTHGSSVHPLNYPSIQKKNPNSPIQIHTKKKNY